MVPAGAGVRPHALVTGDVRVLLPADVGTLGLGWRNRSSADEARSILAAYPGRSVWRPDSREFVIVGPWRHRPEIAVVQELAAVRHGEALLAAVVERCRAAGDEMVLVIELDETRRPSFYARAGLAPVEEVITYELERPGTAGMPGPLVFEAVDSADEAGVAELLRIDHAAFPWLWRNSEAEFRVYLGTPGVRVFLGRRGAEPPVAYVGITSYNGWGHLDRIAVDPAVQGEGLGRQALEFAVAALARRGARRIGLSTQRDNVRSQRLYEAFGFRRSRLNDYRLYGAALGRVGQVDTYPGGGA